MAANTHGDLGLGGFNVTFRLVSSRCWQSKQTGGGNGRGSDLARKRDRLVRKTL
jgi:hypothetical protein